MDKIGKINPSTQEAAVLRVKVWLVDGCVQTEVDLLKMQMKVSHLLSFLFVLQKSARWCRWLAANYRSYTSHIFLSLSNPSVTPIYPWPHLIVEEVHSMVVEFE